MKILYKLRRLFSYIVKLYWLSKSHRNIIVWLDWLLRNFKEEFELDIFFDATCDEYYREFPVILVDVGASGGIEPNWRKARKYLKTIGFEPDEREFRILERQADNNTKYLNVGLYNKKTSLDIYLTKKQQASSVFKPNYKFIKEFPEPERFELVGKTKLKTDTLDNQFKIHNIEDADFIKIDTQGSELFILQGASNTIKQHIFGLEVEVEFVEMYENQPLFSDVDSFLRKEGFQLFDIQRFYWKKSIGKNYGKLKGQLVFGNALYFKKVEHFIKTLDEINNHLSKKSKILRAISICLLYGYVDYAYEILNTTSSLFDPKESQIAIQKIRSMVPLANRTPDFSSKSNAEHTFYKASKILESSHNGWGTCDRTFGNL